MPTLDERLAQIQKESGDLWLLLGQKEYARRVLDAEIIQLSQKLLQLNQEADTLKRATASGSSA